MSYFQSLGYLDDLYRLFFNKYNNLFVIHLTPALEIRKTIHNYIFTFLLYGTLAFNELQIDKAEQRHLNKQLYSSSGSHVPYMEGLAAFLTKITPIISSSMKLLFDRFSKTPTVIKSADVVPIWQRNFSTIPYTGSNTSSSTNESINDSWESLVNTTLSYQMLLLPFISFNLLSRVESRIVQIAESIGLYCYVTKLIYIFIFILIYFIIFILYIYNMYY